MDFECELKRRQDLINSELQKLLKPSDKHDKNIESAMAYSLFAGGKRIRPILCISICSGLGGNIDQAIGISCAMEMIHTYSLIHDDLPAMDNDDLRRGKLTSHKVYGEAMAILAGDGLLNFAFETMFDVIKKNNYQKKFVDAASFIANAAGMNGMILGQVKDIQNENKNIAIEELYDMHRLKTGALIEAASIAGCLISGQEKMLDCTQEYGRNLGIAFQIVDDILDYEGDSNLLGKNVGVDLKHEKSTFVTILGIEKSKELAKHYTDCAQDKAIKLDSTGFLKYLTGYLLNRVN